MFIVALKANIALSLRLHTILTPLYEESVCSMVRTITHHADCTLSLSIQNVVRPFCRLTPHISYQENYKHDFTQMFGKKTAIFKLTDLKKLKVLDFHILLSKTHSSNLYFQYGLKNNFWPTPGSACAGKCNKCHLSVEFIFKPVLYIDIIRLHNIM